MLYSGLLGALSAGILEGGSTIASDVQTTNAGKTIQKAGAVDRLTKLGSTFSADTVAYKLAGKVDENTGAYTVGRLFQEVGATLSEQNMSEIVAGLEAKGIETKTAKKLAQQYQEFLNGEMELTDQQVAVLENLDPLSDVLRKNIIGRNTTTYQRMRGYSDLLNLAKEVGNGKTASSADANTIETSIIPLSNEEMARRVSAAENGVDFEDSAVQQGKSSTNSGTAQKNAKESQFLSSIDGKTIYKDKEVSVQKIDSIKDGEVFVRLNDGNVVNAKEVSFGSKDEALMYEVVTNMDVDTANAMIAGFDSSEGIPGYEYAKGFEEAYIYGKTGIHASEMNRDDGFSASLSERKKNWAYKLGQEAGKSEVKSKQDTIAKAKESVKNAQSSVKKQGKLTYLDKDIKPRGNNQKSAIKAAEILSESIGNNWYIFESYVDKQGIRVFKDVDGKVKSAPNGWYDPANGDVYIDLNAGQNGEGLMLFTMSHELTHFIRQWSPAKFKVFADFLIEQYAEKGISVNELVQRKIEKAEAIGKKLDFDTAYEEVVADSCEAMLRDSNAIEVIAKLKAKDQTVWEKIKNFISKLVTKIRNAYEKLNPDSVEANYVLEMKEAAEKLQTLWTDALVDAGEAYSTINGMVQIDADSESVEKILNEYKGGHRSFPEAKDVVSDFVKEYKDGVKFSDRDYLNAVDRGDMKTAQKMVDEAAKKAGYTIKAYHGSRNVFNAFDKSQRGTNTRTKSSEKWFFAGDIDTANSYYPYGVMKELAKQYPNMWKESVAEKLKNKGKLYSLYLKMDNPLVADVAGYDYDSHREKADAMMEFVEQAERDGNDGIILYHVRDNQLRPSAEESTVFMFRESAQAKLADPVVKDDNGNVIPLSERFNSQKEDIRYSFRDSKSGMANDGLSSYDNELKGFIERRGDYIVDSFDKLRKIVNMAFDKPTTKATAYFGIINPETLEKIKNSIPNLPKASKEILFKNGRDYSIAVTFDSIRHIVDDKKSLKRQDVIDYLDRLADTVVDFDSVSFSFYERGKEKTSGILFKKKFSDGTLVSYDLVSHNKRSLVLQSLYMDSVDYKKKKSAETLLLQNATTRTSETQVGQTSDNIVPQDTNSVNSFSEKKSKNSQKFSERDPDSISNRSLLANALETAAKNDIERNKLEQYKKKIELINSEEQQLHDLREQIKELSFAKGSKDIAKIKELQFEANQAANRINIYDRQLLTLEASKPLNDVLEREKKLAYKKAEQKGKDALSAYREKATKTQRELMNRYQESRAKATEGRHKTEMRHKIKDVVSKLNQLLTRPTKDKHVKEELRGAVAEALAIINMDTIGAEERVAKYNALIAKTNDPDMIAELTKTRDRIQLQGDGLKDKLTALQTVYAKIKDSTDPELKNAYQEPVMNTIKNVSDIVGNTSLRDMNMTQLEAVYDMYSMILHTVRTANKMFKAKKGETITQAAEKVNAEIRRIGKEKFARSPISATIRKVGWTLLKPYTAFRTMGSDTFTGMFKELRNGEDTFYVDINEARSFLQEKYKKYNFKSWDQKQTKTFTSKSGKTFTLTLEQMMSLYAYSRRNQAHDHIIEGGIVLEESVIKTKKHGIPVKYKVDTKTAFNISEETLQEICDSLTNEQRTFVEEMQTYLSDVMGAKGNEVSMELLGVKLFKEKFYFPLKSSKYYMGFKPEEAGEIKLKNPAFSKETVQHANNPVVLKNFTDVWATHINDMSMYHAFVLPLEDFTRVYNYKTKTAANLETMSTEATIANAYGEGATQYIRNFLKSLNGGVRIDGVAIADKLTSLAKKGAVLGSASVMIQQPSAIMRAMAYINPKYFVTSTPQSLNLVKHNKDWAELKEYAPIAGIKEMGRFDIGMGQGTVDWIKDQKTVREKADEALSKAPAFMDEITWVSIWQAVKKEIASTTNLQAGSEAFLKKCGERFTEVVSLSQVYDSVFSRSDLMRNANPIAKMLTAFMAESSTTLNMIWDSWVQGKRSGSKKEFVKITAGTSGAIVGSIVLNSALKSIITAMRDDDEDESYWEKYLGDLVGNTKDGLNPFTYIPFVKDIVSIFKGYDVGRMDMDLFADLYQALNAMDSESKTEYEKWSGLVGAISAFFGVPIKNVERDIRGAYNTIKSFITGEKTTSAGILNAIEEGLTGKEESNTQQLYEAYLSDDKEQIKRVEGRFEDESEIKSALRKALRENDPRIREAAQAIIYGNPSERVRLTREIVAEGHFPQNIIVGAINNELTKLRKEIKEKNSKKTKT